jgi:hypothetical protein
MQDILINNAAQTLTRPEAWTVKMYALEEDAAMQLEDRPGGKATIKLVPPPHVGMPTVRNIGDMPEPEPEPEQEQEQEQEPGQESTKPPVDGDGADAAADADAAVAVARASDGSAISMDESGQPLDLSGVNSWSRRLSEVSTSELLQTMAVNAAAPFVLCSRLKPLLSWRDADESTCAMMFCCAGLRCAVLLHHDARVVLVPLISHTHCACLPRVKCTTNHSLGLAWLHWRV